MVRGFVEPQEEGAPPVKPMDTLIPTWKQGDLITREVYSAMREVAVAAETMAPLSGDIYRSMQAGHYATVADALARLRSALGERA